MSDTFAAFLGRVAPAMIIAAGCYFIYPPSAPIAFGLLVWIETRLVGNKK